MTIAPHRLNGKGHSPVPNTELRILPKRPATTPGTEIADAIHQYEIRKIRIGIHATLLILAVVGMALFVLTPHPGSLPTIATLAVLIAAVLGVATLLVAPWQRLLESRVGVWCIHAWSLFDVGLITLAILAAGDASSELFYLYALTTALFAVTYSTRAQIVLLGLTITAYLGLVASFGWPLDPGTLALRVAFLTSLAILGNLVSGELVRLLSAQHDVTRKLAELDSLRSDFLSTVSHELRTPLAAIGGFATTLQSHSDKIHEELRADLIQRISTNAGELDRLITQLLDFSRAERGQLRYDLVPVDLNRHIRETLDRLADICSSHRIQVVIPPGTWAMADAEACDRIVENLITNAVKFSAPDSSITIFATERGDEVIVGVRDEGIGVASEEHERIFERFYRSERGDSASNGGTGIGLAIVKQFVEAQDGRVWVDSEPDQGSSFSFALRRPGSPRVSSAKQHSVERGR